MELRYFEVVNVRFCVTRVTVEMPSCKICNKSYDKSFLKEKGYYFIVLGIREQLERLLSHENVANALTVSNGSSNFLSDINDGCLYKKKLKNSLTLNMNCDGIPIYKSSSVSLWPIQLSLNELPPKMRKENIILAALWFGPSKPSTYTYFEPFTKELKELASEGISWKKAGECIESKVFMSVCACDSVARCMLQGVKQFNGEYGCGMCLNKGEVVEKGRGRVRVYSWNDTKKDARTNQSIRIHAAEAVRSESPVYGVKGPSPLFQVPNFDLVEGFPPDSLHAIYLGVGRQMASLWLDSSNHSEEFYLGGSVQEIDRNLASIFPPTEITRTPRPISQRVHWKGSEWRSWIIFYSLFSLKGILLPRFLSHWMLLVHSVFCLNKEKITSIDLQSAAAALNKFVWRFSDLYGKKHLSYNVHQLLHLVQSVKNWGPLWTHSTFWFEGNLRNLTKLFKGTNGVPKQIASKFLAWNQLNYMIHAEDDLIAPVHDFLMKAMNKYVHVKLSIQADIDSHFLGSPSYRNLSIEEKFALNRLNGSEEDHGKFYVKAIINSVCVHSKMYRRHNLRINYCVHLRMGQTAFVENFLMLDDQIEAYAFVRYLELDRTPLVAPDSETGASASHVSVVMEPQNQIHAIYLSSIVGKYVVCKQNDKIICCRLPNLLERD